MKRLFGLAQLKLRLWRAPRWLLIGMIAWLVSGAVYVASSSIYSLYYEHTVTVEASPEIAMYADSECTIMMLNASTIDWGNLTGGTHIKIFWLRNEGNVNVTLSLAVQDLPSGWSCTWDREGYVLQPAEVVQVTITLTIPDSALAGDYSFKIWINAEAS